MNEWTDSTEYMLRKRLEGRGCCVELREGIGRPGKVHWWMQNLSRNLRVNQLFLELRTGHSISMKNRVCKYIEEEMSTKYLREQTDLGRMQGVGVEGGCDKTGQLGWDKTEEWPSYSNRRMAILWKKPRLWNYTRI